MAKDDTIDPILARRFAWGLSPEPESTPDGESSPAKSPPTETRPDASEVSMEEWRAKARFDCAALADAVDRVWAMAESAQQAAATEEIVGRASDLGLAAMGMKDHPLQSVRLLRLVVRHRDRLPDAVNQRAIESALWLEVSHAESVELLVAVARAGDRAMESALFMALKVSRKAQALPWPALAPRLSELIVDGPTWEARRIALNFAGWMSSPAIVPALRRALRFPHLASRWLALHALCDRFPDAITADDVVFLLADAVEHPAPDICSIRDEVFQSAHCYYPGLLERVAVALRPPGASRSLLRIVAGDCVEWGWDRDVLGAAWALEVLAAAYPDEAEQPISELLASHETRFRAAAVRAAIKLPAHRARAHLTRAATDGAPDVSNAAREGWTKLFVEPCPVDEIAGVERSLLEAEPSETLRVRVLALRGPAEARVKLAGALLAQAPDPEALAILVLALADHDLFSYLQAEGLPPRCEAWCDEIVARFGARGVRGLCTLAVRYPRSRRYGWLYQLCRMLEKGLIGEASYPDLRAVALERLRDGSPPSFDQLSILAKTGSPPDAASRLLSLALDPEQSWYMRSTASIALHRSDAREHVIADVVRAIDDALQARDGSRAVVAGSVGARIPAQGTLDGVTRVLRLLGGLTRAEGKLDAELVEEAARMIWSLRDAGHDQVGWIQEALCQPDSCGFSIAAAASKGEVARPIRKLLREALGSESRDGAAAAEAAQALVGLGELGTRSPRLQRVFSRAPLEERTHLLRVILLHRMRRPALPLGPIWSHVAELLTTTDERVLPAVRELPLIVLRSGADRDRLRRIYERIVDPEVRSAAAMALGVRAEQRERYWQDSEEE